MSRVKTHDTYIEIPNGLFIDIEKEKPSITTGDLKEILESIVEKNSTNRSFNREVAFFSGEERMRQYSRAVQEEACRQFIEMSEQETIEYFDRISQDEEQQTNTEH